MCRSRQDARGEICNRKTFFCATLETMDLRLQDIVEVDLLKKMVRGYIEPGPKWTLMNACKMCPANYQTHNM